MPHDLTKAFDSLPTELGNGLVLRLPNPVAASLHVKNSAEIKTVAM